MRVYDVLNQSGSNGDDEKWADSGYILEYNLQNLLVDGLWDTVKKQGRFKSFAMSNCKDGIFINCVMTYGRDH